MEKLTPVMKQYFDTKAKHPDCLLFFRLGDFYEMFSEDAKTASRELQLTLTTRDRQKPEAERMPMCGVPYHSALTYIAKLVKRGYKVAVCEQMEDPATAKGIVRRDVVRVLSPGTVIDEGMLDERDNNYVAAVYDDGDTAALCFADVSVGVCNVAAFEGRDRMGRLDDNLVKIRAAEVLREADNPKIFAPDCGEIEQAFGRKTSALIEPLSAARIAVCAVLRYLKATVMESPSMGLLNILNEQPALELDARAMKHLEITASASGEREHSLLGILDKTRTPMGSRQLREYVERPLRNAVEIDARLSAVEELKLNTAARSELRARLKGFPDLERVTQRIVYGRSNPREIRGTAEFLRELIELREYLKNAESSLLIGVYGGIDPLEDLAALCLNAITDDPPVTLKDGGVIRTGYHPDADRLRYVKDHALTLIAECENTLKNDTGIKTLKVGYNNVFGYYIEVSKANLHLVPEYFERRQTMTNGERYITKELRELEREILSAQDELVALENRLYADLLSVLSEAVGRFRRTAKSLGVLDALLSLAECADVYRYVRPVVDLSDRIEITEGRHPVVERVADSFVPNDSTLSGGSPVAVITGPNMAGKSTFMRQTALIALMAHIGSFVPARSARIGILDRIFTRIGAQDDLAGGRSTFMVEMTEVADILKNATAHSLVILDEIGRGTSTYDGMAIARAVLERLCVKTRAKTLFATHYHELTALEGLIPGVRNYNVAVKKRAGGIVFLRKIIPGGADDSYGVEVAKLAGLPDSVIRRATELLNELETAAVKIEKAPDSGQLSFDQTTQITEDI